MSKWTSPGGRTQEFADTPANESALKAAGYTKVEGAKTAPAKKKAAAKKAK